MPTDSIFLRYITPEAMKILDFFVVHQEYGYSAKEISKLIHSDKIKVKNALSQLAYLGIVAKKRHYYQLNKTHLVTKSFIDFYWKVID